MEYAILGGGALGLMAGYRLAQAGHHVMVFERENIAGGLAGGFHVGDDGEAWLEKFYHHLFRSDTTAIATIKELGLGERLAWSHPRTVTLTEGKIYQLDSALSLLQFSPLHFVERIRLGAVIAFLKVTNSAPLEGKTAAPWLRRWTGKLAYEKLVEKIHAAGGKVLLGTRVDKVEQGQDERWQVQTNAGTWTFDRVISTLPTRLTCRLVPALPQDYRSKYEWGQAYGAQCLILALDRQLTDSYWINICDPGYPFTGLFEHTNFRPAGEYGGRHLVYLGNYRPMDDPLFKMNKEEILAEFLPHLKRIRPDFEPGWVTESWLFQAPFAQPIVTTEYPEHIPPLHTPLKGLWLANMFQIYPHDRGQNYSFDLANQLVRQLQKA